jgi:hypothetical protein
MAPPASQDTRSAEHYKGCLAREANHILGWQDLGVSSMHGLLLEILESWHVTGDARQIGCTRDAYGHLPTGT